MNQKHIMAGVVGGIVGGVVFGVLMQMMGMMPMIASMIGSDATSIGWITHLVISAVTGALFVLVFGSAADTYGRGAVYGLLYGAIWWVFGALILMPVILGMGVQFSSAFDQLRLMSLMGHAVFGVLLGLVYISIAKKDVVM